VDLVHEYDEASRGTWTRRKEGQADNLVAAVLGEELPTDLRWGSTSPGTAVALGPQCS
jgi:hypothetical protein